MGINPHHPKTHKSPLEDWITICLTGEKIHNCICSLEKIAHMWSSGEIKHNAWTFKDFQKPGSRFEISLNSKWSGFRWDYDGRWIQKLKRSDRNNLQVKESPSHSSCQHVLHLTPLSKLVPCMWPFTGHNLITRLVGPCPMLLVSYAISPRSHWGVDSCGDVKKAWNCVA